MNILLAMIIGYLIGSISTSYLAGRLVAGIDIRDYGSGNAGATNTLRVLGKKVGIPVFVIDIAKGVVAVWIGLLLSGGNPWVEALGGTCAIVGHNWPVFHRFRGGRGIATTIGVMCSLAFVPTLVVGMIAIVVLAITRYVSLGSLVFAALLPVGVLVDRRPFVIFLFSLILTVLAFWRHRDNIRRLLSGTESKLGQNRLLR